MPLKPVVVEGGMCGSLVVDGWAVGAGLVVLLAGWVVVG